ncbi:cation diffusion facilitator family transporter [Burkholderia multivorans]|uniref:cation diffusion facilitator family transporter n=2 Tax=Burkholderia multivorans TaxID=87883 RepID=UPI000D00E3C2|nr:cation diffusion facilitator family transporter [Burkholderia multivorans]MBR8240306.1 cation diffusion facilitator family transporter [Burkholderia multivorans]MDR9179450.1 Cadmium, cobalt and zinc/H(+)-K(+) antiporter [Burkholderia multivorans]MDR9184503.1 Cadmium, cobalt and zinc/H(+)-K(+) antiporter [Burkholderia multivorans]MDR9189979.1 Cadmium, cobalt and zinc/H(+)-K(+) antiporter [Burkholderia multivorans]MDR9195898.1 Cadmium, cobalt and zinc/H(+)-K(+) antiporter [Burkholderia multiv
MQRPTRVTPHLHTATSRALAIGLAINALLLVTELIAGWAAHSSGLLADALHAAVDLAADALLLIACRMDARLPPERRPTFEPIALAGLGTLLVAMGLQMIWQAATHFDTPPRVAPGAVPLALVAVTLVGKVALSRWLLAWARETGSALLEANGWHVRADALSALLATVAMSAAWVGLGRIDDLAALAIGAIVIRTGAGFVRRACAYWPGLAAWASRSIR